MAVRLQKQIDRKKLRILDTGISFTIPKMIDEL